MGPNHPSGTGRNSKGHVNICQIFADEVFADESSSSRDDDGVSTTEHLLVDGGQLTWRVGAKAEPGTTKCGNPLPEGVAWREEARLGRQLSAVNVTTYAWVYVFPEEGGVEVV